MDTASGVPTTDADVAVVFVHGIGSQLRSRELTRWGDALLGWLGDWAGPRGGWQDTTEDNEWPRRVRMRHSDSGSSAHAATADLEVQRGAETLQVHLAEALWADEVVAPSFRALIGWVLRLLTLAVTHHVAAGLGAAVLRNRSFWNRATPANRAWAAARWVATGIAFLLAPLVTVVLTPIVGLLLITLLLLGVLGSLAPGLRRPAMAVQQMLTATLGDTFFVLRSDIQRGYILGKVQRTIDDARARLRPDGRLVVVAHSQGAWVAHRTLLESSLPDRSVDLVTFGQGLAKIERLGQGNAPQQAVARIVGPVLTPLLFLLAVANPDAVRIGSLAEALQLLSLGLIPLALIGLLWWGLAAVVGRVADALEERDARPAAAGARAGWSPVRWMMDEGQPLVALGLTYVAARLLALLEFTPVTAYAERLDDSVSQATVMLLGLSLLTLGWTAAALTQVGVVPLAVPSCVDRWRDLYASADPVSNGPLPGAFMVRGADPLVGPHPQVTTTELRNHRDPIRDHVSYWRNREQFVPRVAAVILPRFWIPISVIEDGDRRRRNAGICAIAARLAGLAAVLPLRRALDGWTVAELPTWLALPGENLPASLQAWLATLTVLAAAVLLTEALTLRLATAGHRASAGQSRTEYVLEVGPEARDPA